VNKLIHNFFTININIILATTPEFEVSPSLPDLWTKWKY